MSPLEERPGSYRWLLYEEIWSLEIHHLAYGTRVETTPGLNLLELRERLWSMCTPRVVEFIFWGILERRGLRRPTPATSHTLRFLDQQGYWRKHSDQSKGPRFEVSLCNPSRFTRSSFEVRHACFALLGLVSHSSREEFMGSYTGA